MATEYAATCRDCGHEYTFTAGPLMTGTRYTCLDCGDTILIRNCAPKGSPEMSRDQLLMYLAGNHLDLDGRDFSPGERRELDSIAKTCYCGGTRQEDEDLSEEVLDGSAPVPDVHRCPECKSNRVDVEIDALYD